MEAKINAFPGYQYVYDTKNKKYINYYRGMDIGRGGYVYAEEGMYYNVGLLDCRSQHPSSAILMKAFGKYTEKYEELYNLRQAIKTYDYDSASKMFGGALTKYLEDETAAEDLANAIKLCLNSTYGISIPDYSPFHDPRNVNNVIALRGALFMKTLQDAVVERGYRVISVRTDSLKVPNVTPEIISFMQSFAEDYGYVLEHEATYDRMCLVNDSNYIGKYDEYGVRNKKGKHAGQWTATGAQFAQSYVFKTLFSKEPLEFEDLCEAKEVKGGSNIYLDLNEGLGEENHCYRFIGRVGLFTPIKDGCGGGELKVYRGEKYDAVAGTKGYRWLESEQVRLMSLEESIDMSYYRSLADKAIEAISKYGDFDLFVKEGD